MQYHRIWSDEQGESHIELVEVDFGPLANFPRVGQSGEWPALNAHFLRIEPSSVEGSWHLAPCRLFALNISGQCEMETSDGARVVGVPGTVVLVEDTTGKGHLVRVTGDEPFVCMRVMLDDDASRDPGQGVAR